MWFKIVYGVEGDNLHTTEIWADNLDDAFDYARVFASEEYYKIAGEINGYPTFSDFWQTQTTDDMFDAYDNNRAEYDQLCERYMKLVDSKIIVRAYYI